MQKTRVYSFTIRYNGLFNVLFSDCGIHSAIDDPEQTNPNSLKPKSYKAIWDTGATNTSITKKVAEECNLEPTRPTVVNTASGQDLVDVYLASIFLPNDIIIPLIAVNEAVLKDFDVLIGMDIIGQGDFAVSNKNQVTQFSFRMPSLVSFDFTDLSGGGQSGRNRRRKKRMTER